MLMSFEESMAEGTGTISDPLYGTVTANWGNEGGIGTTSDGLYYLVGTEFTRPSGGARPMGDFKITEGFGLSLSGYYIVGTAESVGDVEVTSNGVVICTIHIISEAVTPDSLEFLSSPIDDGVVTYV